MKGLVHHMLGKQAMPEISYYFCWHTPSRECQAERIPSLHQSSVVSLESERMLCCQQILDHVKCINIINF